MSFNTASGRHIHSIRFVFPSFHSWTRDLRTSSSLCSSVASPPSSHTASGKYCCNLIINSLTMHLYSISRFNTASGKYIHSIIFVFPSLRSGTRDVRTSSSLCSSAASHPSSHTVNSKYCCNCGI